MENAEIDRLVMKPTARRRLGKYVLLGRLGHGGMGKIYLAYAPGPAGIEKLLVVKRLHSHLTGDPVLVNSFLDEARLSMALNHPNIVHTYDVGEVDGRYFMVMEYIDGQNLGVVLRTAKRSQEYPSSALWAGLFLSVLDGLHAAHVARDARGRPLHIIHRDVSPQNILVTHEGLAKLVDFGIAKAAMRVSDTDAGVLKGKYAYMSPEQVRGEPLDARSDVFAAGVVLWEMLAGRRLYKADSVVRSVERILTEQPISPVRVNSECDPEIARIAFKALQKDREQRFASALEMKDALDDALRKTGARPRQTDVRDLMHRLFGSVIEKQRAVLEACLAENEQAASVPDDEDGVGPRGSDSESDVSMKALHGRLTPSGATEVTTPSGLRAAAARPSPLVSGDGERDEGSRPSLPRRKTPGAMNASSALVDPDGPPEPSFPLPPATPSAPAPSPALSPTSSPAPMPSPILSPGQAMFPSGEKTTPDVPDDARRPFPLLAAGLALLVVGGVATLAFALWPRPAAPDVVVAAAERAAVDAPSAEVPVAVAPATADAVADAGAVAVPADAEHAERAAAATGEEAIGEEATGERATGERATGERATGERATGEAAPREGATGEGATSEGAQGDSRARAPAEPEIAVEARRRPPPRRAARDDKKSDVRADRPERPERPDKREEKAGGDDKHEDKAVVDTGTLSLDTVPWTIVYLGKKRLGETPLVKVAVPAGTLELTLVNAEANVRETYVATVKPGENYKARLDLN